VESQVAVQSGRVCPFVDGELEYPDTQGKSPPVRIPSSRRDYFRFRADVGFGIEAANYDDPSAARGPRRLCSGCLHKYATIRLWKHQTQACHAGRLLLHSTTYPSRFNSLYSIIFDINMAAPWWMKYLNSQIQDDGGLRLTLVKNLGFGAFGAVFLARSEEPFATQYAVKVMPKPPKGSYHYERAIMEIRLHRRVSAHPSVVTLQSVIEDEDTFFLVLDLHLGGDLFDSIIQDQSITKRKERSLLDADQYIKRIFLQILDAVEYCHERNVFHCDLKPENVLMSADGESVYLADFGLSLENDTSVLSGCGSDHYMSPGMCSPCSS
jgi:hypothetical protein